MLGRRDITAQRVLHKLRIKKLQHFRLIFYLAAVLYGKNLHFTDLMKGMVFYIPSPQYCCHHLQDLGPLLQLQTTPDVNSQKHPYCQPCKSRQVHSFLPVKAQTGPKGPTETPKLSTPLLTGTLKPCIPLHSGGLGWDPRDRVERGGWLLLLFI